MILLAEIQILFLDNIWISHPLLSWICVPIGYQEQQRYFEYSYRIFYPLFLESQQTVLRSCFYNNVHVSCHLYDHTSQIHLKVRLSFELSQSLPVSMTKMYYHGFLLLLALSHLHIKVQNQKVCCILAVQRTFFQIVFY